MPQGCSSLARGAALIGPDLLCTNAARAVTGVPEAAVRVATAKPRTKFIMDAAASCHTHVGDRILRVPGSGVKVRSRRRPEETRAAGAAARRVWVSGPYVPRPEN